MNSMYQEYYSLAEHPFSLMPDATSPYLGQEHGKAFSILEYGMVSQAGCVVITGDIGSGKTTLIQHLLNSIGGGCTVGLLSNTQENMGELLRWVLRAYGQDYEGGSQVALYDRFSRYLIDQYANNRRTVLIIDEAQNLSYQAIEELRMLLNINANKDLLLQLLLVGQNELRDLLLRPELKQLRQRVAVNYHLKALNSSETRAYIHHRIRQAGGERELFTGHASELIWKASKGIPRAINSICDYALVYGYAKQIELLNAEHIDHVLCKMHEAGSLTAEDFGQLRS